MASFSLTKDHSSINNEKDSSFKLPKYREKNSNYQRYTKDKKKNFFDRGVPFIDPTLIKVNGKELKEKPEFILVTEPQKVEKEEDKQPSLGLADAVLKQKSSNYELPQENMSTNYAPPQTQIPTQNSNYAPTQSQIPMQNSNYAPPQTQIPTQTNIPTQNTNTLPQENITNSNTANIPTQTTTLPVEEIPLATTTYSSEELEQLKKLQIPNYKTYDRIQIKNLTQQFLFKIERLRECYPNYKYPALTFNTPLEEIHIFYNNFNKFVRTEEKVLRYRTFMMISWMILEVIMLYFGLNFSGYTNMQIKNIKRYEPHILEWVQQEQEQEEESGNKKVANPTSQLFWSTLTSLIFFSITSVLAKFLPREKAESITTQIQDFFCKSPSDTVEEPAAVPSKGKSDNIVDQLISGNLSSFIGPVMSMMQNSASKSNSNVKVEETRIHEE